MRRDGLQRLCGVAPSRERRVLLGEEHAPWSQLVIPHDRRRFARGKGIAYDRAQYVGGYVCSSELGGEVGQHVPADEQACAGRIHRVQHGAIDVRADQGRKRRTRRVVQSVLEEARVLRDALLGASDASDRFELWRPRHDGRLAKGGAAEASLPTPCASADGKTTATYATMSGWEATLGGWTRVRYLLHVAAVAPAQREAALVEAAAYMQAHLWDADKLRSVRCEAGMPNEAAWDAWLATTAAHVHEEQERLLADLAASQHTPERARRIHCVLGAHFRRRGAFRAALEHYESAREYGITNEHALASYVGILQTAHDMGDAERVLLCYEQAHTMLRALERSHSTEGWQLVRDVAGLPDASCEDVAARLAAWRLVAQWTLCRDALPEPLLSEHSDAYADLLGPAQGAWYAVLWALCVHPPSVQRARAAQVLQDASFRQYTDVARAPRDVLSTYLVSDWPSCIALVRDAHASAWRCDPAIGVQRADTLLHTLLTRLIECHVQAYTCVPLASLSRLFGDSVPRILLDLIRSGAVPARIDWARQVLEKEDVHVVDVRPSDMSALRARLTVLQRLSLATSSKSSSMSSTDPST